MKSVFGRRKFKKKGGRGNISRKIEEKALRLVKNFFNRQSGQKIRAILLTTAHTNKHAEEREREKRERERGSTFSERKMSATQSALKASPQEVNAEEENVLASRDDDVDEEEQKEREEQERGPSVGKEEEQEECVVFFFSLCYLFLNDDDDDD
jgi:hypothetical protein